MSDKEKLLEAVKELMRMSWISAAQAHRLYPNNNHTFVAYWNALGESQMNDILKEYKLNP
jgi:hypothetical protein